MIPIETTHVTDGSKDRGYFTLIPNYVAFRCSDTYEMTAWVMIKMVAGETGECFLSTDDLALLCKMSPKKMKGVRRSLIEKGLIEGSVRRDLGYVKPVWHLRIPDLWAKNIKFCKDHPGLKEKMNLDKGVRHIPVMGVQDTQVPQTPLGGPTEPMMGVPQTLKEDLTKKIQQQERTKKEKYDDVDLPSIGQALSHANELRSIREADVLLSSVLGVAALPYSFLNRIEAVQAAIDQYGNQAVGDALREAKTAWKARTAKDGRQYSLMNPVWVDWAIMHLAGETPWKGAPAAIENDPYAPLMRYLERSENGAGETNNDQGK